MSLGPDRIVFQGETPYAHEREAIDFTIATLPNNDPFHLWALLELLDPSSGRLYELDMLVLGYSALYLVEIKSGPGRYEGDHQDWYRTPPGETHPRYLENPYRLTNHKAKVLAERIKAKMREPRLCPWIEPLIFLSHEDIQLHLRDHGNVGVVTRSTLLDALQRHQYPGARRNREPTRIPGPVVRDVSRAIEAIGLRPRKGKAYVGSYELGALIEEGPGWQDRHAQHRDQPSMTRRARIYLVPQQSDVARRQQLRRAADREAQLLQDVRDHPSILRINDYVTDAPLGPTVLFDPFDDGVPLPTFLRQNPDLVSADHVAIIEQVGRALSYCHRRGIVHGGVSPESVLVRKRPGEGGFDVRLFNFQLGLGARVDATSHWSALAADRWSIYQAPELRVDSSSRSPRSDMFSLGALAFFTFTGQHPAESIGEIERRLAEARHLDPRLVNDGIHEPIAELVRNATAYSPIQRDDDAEAWVELLLDFATQPDPLAAVESDPLEARHGETIGDGLIVDGLLGQGATSRVLKVLRLSDERSYALKIALDAGHHDRFETEAQTIENLRHPRIVQLIDRPTIGDRRCLLLSLAGEETLHKYLAREGTVSLDLASRYGEDLLSALEHLEEAKVLHRDIKPANLGVGRLSKSAARLTLFDFSLGDVPPSRLEVGTAAYRDPYLPQRGSWDHAAERWSAAITLHEMLTGVRPALSDASSEPVIAAERFDPSVRGALVEFFARALARDVERRFGSAEEMRRAWIGAVETSTRPVPETAPSVETSEHPTEPEALTDERLREVSPDTPIEGLPLSNRARNALDRAGMLRASDLLGLADNRLSAIRGIGTSVAREILTFRNKWRELSKVGDVESSPFFRGYRGDDLQVHVAGIDEALANALQDAGLNALTAVAGAPRHQVEALAKRHEVEPRVLQDLLERENRSANERKRPSTLEGWIDALLPRHSKAGMKHPRALFGLDGEFAGRLDVMVKELSEKSSVTTAAIYIALGKARTKWGKHPAIDELRAQTGDLVAAGDGAISVSEAATRLLAVLPHDRSRDAALLSAEAAALLRIASDIEREDCAGLSYIRMGSGAGWLCAGDAHARAVRALGTAADELADRPVVAGPGEVARVLAHAVEGTPLATASPARLVDLATQASEGAARSARLEVYPKGMPAHRALTLSASLLRSGMTPSEVIARVKRRYPEARPLPPRPDLDDLVRPHGLQWSDEAQRYVRPGAIEESSYQTRMTTLARAETALPTEPRSMEPGPVIARRFDEQLRSAVERRQFRLLGVRADAAHRTALELAKRIRTTPVAFDRLLVAEIRSQIAKVGIRDDIVHAADRAGRRGQAWGNLMNLVNAAAAAVVERLVPAREPLLLVQPGLIARYRLESVLKRLLEASKRPESAAILLLVPSTDTGGIPRINGELTVPGLLASQSLWIPPEWIRNEHETAA
jgi:serine/threonine protein kinase